MNRLSTKQLDWRCDGESRSYRGRVAHVVVVAMRGGIVVLPPQSVSANEATAGKPTGFDGLSCGSPG